MMQFILILAILGGFTQKWYFMKGTYYSGGRLLIADTDHDTQTELLFTTYSDIPAYIYIYEFTPVIVSDSILLPGGDLLWDGGDFDNDGLCDLVLQFHVENPVANGIMIYESPDSFSYPTQEVWRDTVGQGGVVPISVFDVDNDSYSDIFHNSGDGQPHWVWVYESISNNQYDTVYTFNPMVDTFPQSTTSTYAFGDFDDDDRYEFVMGDLSAGAYGADYWVFECPVDNFYEQIHHGYVQTKNVKDCFSVPDSDQDGKDEFVIKGFMSGTIHAFIFEATGNNTYEIIQSFSLPGGDYYGGHSDAGDVDGDGIPEIILEARQNVFVIKSSGNNSFYIWDTLPGHSTGSNIRVTNDIDGNGLNEIVISGNDITRGYEYDGGSVEEYQDAVADAPMLKIDQNIFIDRLSIELGAESDLGNVSLSIYDVSGRLIKQWEDLMLESSSHVVWDGLDHLNHNVPVGVYYIVLKNFSNVITKKIIKIQ